MSINNSQTEKLTPQHDSPQAKIDYLKRNLTQRRQDVLNLAPKIIDDAKENPDNLDNIVNMWLGDNNPDNWFYANRDFNRLSTIDTLGGDTFLEPSKIDVATPKELEEYVRQRSSEDLVRAGANAVGIVAIEKYLNADDYPKALMVLQARPDLNILPEVTNPITQWLKSNQDKPSFLTKFIPELINSSQFDGHNLLRSYMSGYFGDGEEIVPNGGQEIATFCRVAQEVLNYQHLLSQQAEQKYPASWVDTQVGKKIREAVVFLNKNGSNSATELHQLWIKESTLQNIDVAKKLSSLAKSEWFSKLPSSETKTKITDILTTTSLAELQKIQDSAPSNSDSQLSVLGEAIATAMNFAQPEITQSLNDVVKNFAEVRPGLSSHLTTSIENTRQRFAQEAADAESARKQAEQKKLKNKNSAMNN